MGFVLPEILYVIGRVRHALFIEELSGFLAVVVVIAFEFFSPCYMPKREYKASDRASSIA